MTEKNRYAKSTMLSMKKEELIELIEIIKKNITEKEKTIEIQVRRLEKVVEFLKENGYKEEEISQIWRLEEENI